jgi:WD40 repeat protein
VGRAAARISVSPDSNVVLLGGPLGGEAAINFQTGEARSGFDGLGEGGVLDFFALDGGRVGTVGTKMDAVHLWNAKTGKSEGKVAIPDIPAGAGNAKALHASLSPNGKFMAVGRSGIPVTDNPDVPFRVFDTANNKALVSITWKGGSAFFTADSSRVLVAEWTGRFRWFKLPSGEADGGWDLSPPPPNRRHMVFGISADGSALAYNGPASSKLSEMWPGVMNGKTGEMIQNFKKHHYASDVSISADGKRAALLLDIAGDACTIDVVDVARGDSLLRVRYASGRSMPTFALAPDGSSLLIHDAETNKLSRYDVPTPKSP